MNYDDENDEGGGSDRKHITTFRFHPTNNGQDAIGKLSQRQS